MDSPNPEAVRRLVEKHWHGMVLFARQWTDDPEDVVQEAFVRLFQQTVRPVDEVAWLFRVVRNTAISRVRQQRSRSAREARVAADESCFESFDDQLDARRASAALLSLAPELREVVVARIWGQMTFQQIADVLQISVATAHRRYERGLEWLRGHLGPSFVEPANDEQR